MNQISTQNKAATKNHSFLWKSIGIQIKKTSFLLPVFCLISSGIFMMHTAILYWMDIIYYIALCALIFLLCVLVVFPMLSLLVTSSLSLKQSLKRLFSYNQKIRHRLLLLFIAALTLLGCWEYLYFKTPYWAAHFFSENQYFTFLEIRNIVGAFWVLITTRAASFSTMDILNGGFFFDTISSIFKKEPCSFFLYALLFDLPWLLLLRLFFTSIMLEFWPSLVILFFLGLLLPIRLIIDSVFYEQYNGCNYGRFFV